MSHRDFLGHPVQELGLAQELSLDGIPAQSLIEFEGGGSMLSREVLGEMLATNQRGILNARGGMSREYRSGAALGARRKRGDTNNNSTNCAHGCDGGAKKGGDQARILCQADALKRLQDSSLSFAAHVTTRHPSIGARKSTKRVHTNSGEWGGEQGGRPEEQVRLSVSSPKRHFAILGGSGVDHPVAATSVTFEPSLASGSPNKRRRHKLYDHDHNPRLLRTLVDDTIITGIAGGGALEAEEVRQVEELRLQLRLACHRATELEDLIFQSQTGAPHRELLGELQLHRKGLCGVPLRERPNRNERYFHPAPSRGRVATAAERDKRCRTPDNAGGCGSTQQPCRASPKKKRRERLDVSFSTRKPPETHRLQGGGGGGGGGGPAADNGSPAARREKAPYEAMASCCPPLSPPLTPTESLPRYLSSLRPFSADSARAAWGLADPADGGDLEEPGRDHLRFNGDYADSFGSEKPRWPVLFVMGSSKPPPPRHPLGVYALPLFDEDMVTLLAEAAGERAGKVREMVKILTRFDFGLLHSAVRRLCYAHARDGTGTFPAIEIGRRELAEQRKGAPGPAMQAWGKHAEDASPFPAAATTGVQAFDSSNKVERQAQIDDEPLIMSDAAAGRALVGGFLSGVFGESVVRDIVVASRPVVVFDSTSSAEEDGAAEPPAIKEGVVNSDRRSNDGKYGVLAPTEIDDRVGEDSPDRPGRGRQDGAASVAARKHESSLLSAESREQASTLETAADDISQDFDQLHASQICVKDDVLAAERLRRAPVDSAPGEGRTAGASRKLEKDANGVLVTQLVRAAAARFRVHSLAIRHREVGDASSSHFSTLSCSRGGDFGRGMFIGGSGGSCLTQIGWGQERKLRRPASADSDELGLPPLKLIRGDKAIGRKRVAGGRWREKDGEEDVEMEVDVFGVPRPRSTPRCLRPGYKGEVTAAMLRQELEASESTAARLGITMARKAEAWKKEAQEDGGAVATAANLAANAAGNRAALALASTRVRDALLEAARERMREAVNIMYLGIVRRSWRAWTELVRRQQSLDTAGRVARLAGAAALGFGVVEPLLRRRVRMWLRRWAGAM
ncbi:unnamed protein product, partial [Hapterophycus canaliculatus]